MSVNIKSSSNIQPLFQKSQSKPRLVESLPLLTASSTGCHPDDDNGEYSEDKGLDNNDNHDNSDHLLGCGKDNS